MKRGLLAGLGVTLVALFAAQAVFPAEEAGSGAARVPGSIMNNKYYLESVRLTGLARSTYEEGDYDGSAEYSAEALRYAALSDEFVASQLRMREASDAIFTANARLNWAKVSGAADTHAEEYAGAQEAYERALSLRDSGDWDGAADAAREVISILAFLPEEPAALPSKYTVRPWETSLDCLWNIAGKDWAYGDPSKWRLLYDANRTKLPDPNNPDLIEPGMVLDIPAVKGERRRGVWERGRTYPSLRER